MIFKYELINPVINNKKPFYDTRRRLFLFPVQVPYKYYIEAALNNETTGSREYYILISETKFDDNCRQCHVDSYGRCQVKLRGELQDYVIKESKDRGNISVEYFQCENGYDVYNVI